MFRISLTRVSLAFFNPFKEKKSCGPPIELPKNLKSKTPKTFLSRIPDYLDCFKL